MQYMCDAGLHAVLEKDARKYARLPEFWQLASCASGIFNSIISHEGSCNIQNARRDMLRRALMTCALGDDSKTLYQVDVQRHTYREVPRQ